MAESIAVIPLVKRSLPEAKLPFQDPTVIGTAIAAAARGIGAAKARAGYGR